jgi:hypothetical protein
MLYREIIAVCSEIHTKHINTVCGQNVEFFNAKPGGAYSNHLKVKYETLLTNEQLQKLYRKHINTLVVQNAALFIVIFINCSWVVTRWQYTFTHKQYIEQPK